jgi:hypothetical protein
MNGTVVIAVLALWRWNISKQSRAKTLSHRNGAAPHTGSSLATGPFIGPLTDGCLVDTSGVMRETAVQIRAAVRTASTNADGRANRMRIPPCLLIIHGIRAEH